MNLSDITAHGRYKVQSVRHMFDVPLPEMLVDDLIPKKTITGLTANPNMGKTWWTLELCRAVATGGKFLGRFRAQPGCAVFVGQDSSLHDYARQVRKLIREEYEQIEATDADNPFDTRFHCIIQPGLLLEDRKGVTKLASTVMQLKHSEERRTVESVDYDSGEIHTHEELVYRSGADLIVLDAQAKLTNMDENDNTAMGLPYRNLRWLAETTGACIVLIHHNSYPTDTNDGERWRGARSQEAALDNWFHITRGPRDENADRRLVKCKRFRGLTPDPFHYLMSITEQKATLTFESEAETQKQTLVDTAMQDMLLSCLSDVYISATDITVAFCSKYYSIKRSEVVAHLATYAGVEKLGSKYRLKHITEGSVNADTNQSVATGLR